MPALSERTIENQTVFYDQSGFGIRYNSVELTSNAVRRIIRDLLSLCPSESWSKRPMSDLASYEGLVWTPWHIADGRATPSALADRLGLHSIPLWDSGQWDNYGGSSSSYLSNPCLVGASPSDTLSILSRIHSSIRGMRFLDVGCSCGNTMLNLELHGFECYGIEIDPNFIAHVPDIILDRVLWGDALYSLYAFTQDFFDVIKLSCLGYIMRADTAKLLVDVWLAMKPGSVLLLDLPSNGTDISVLDKVQYGPYVRPSRTYQSVLKSSGFTCVGTFNGLVVATKTHTPTTL